MPQDDEQIWLEERGNEWKARSEVKGNKEIRVNDRIFLSFFLKLVFFKVRRMCATLVWVMEVVRE